VITKHKVKRNEANFNDAGGTHLGVTFVRLKMPWPTSSLSISGDSIHFGISGAGSIFLEKRVENRSFNRGCRLSVGFFLFIGYVFQTWDCNNDFFQCRLLLPGFGGVGAHHVLP
jgi:hypothetical protein